MAYILFFSYIAVVSTLGVILCVADKIAAKLPGCDRVREKTLCAIGLLGGAVAMLLTMLCIRHKTQHTYIMVTMGTASVLWTIVYCIIFGILLHV